MWDVMLEECVKVGRDVGKTAFKKSEMSLTMQYLGGKSRIVDVILHSIDKDFPSQKTFVDLFSGSGVVAFSALKKGYNVIANDIQPYSYSLLKALLTEVGCDCSGIIDEIHHISEQDLFSGQRHEFLEEFIKEQEFFRKVNHSDFDWVDYKNFCDGSVLIEGTAEEVIELRSKASWNLFLHYYRNTYFGVKQCAELDALKELSSKFSPSVQNILDACVISAMTDCVSSTTHLAQYLKPRSESTARALIAKRSKSIFSLVLARLTGLSNRHSSSASEVYNLDFIEALDKLSPSRELIIYADPPYFKEHYSRYYHVLDTYVLYDYPLLTFNKVLNQTTIGRYREGRITSPFGKKTTARNAFEKLLVKCIELHAKLAISYSCSSIVELSFFQELAKSYQIDLKIDEFELLHTGQGQSRHKTVTEYLLKFDVK